MKTFILLLVGLGLSAQTETIIVLPKSDAKILKDAYAQVVLAEKYYQSLKTQVVTSYSVKYDPNRVIFNEDFTAMYVTHFIQGVDSESNMSGMIVKECSSNTFESCTVVGSK